MGAVAASARARPRRPGRFSRHRAAVLALAILISLALLVTLGPALWADAPNAFDPSLATGYPQPPTAQHPLGTDELGRDSLARLLAGGRVSLGIGLLSAAVSLALGLLAGLLAGFLGDPVDTLITRLIDLFLALPGLLLILIASAYLAPSLATTVAAIGAFNWMAPARIVRGQILAAQTREYVLAARMLGASPGWLLRRHLLPAATGATILAASLAVPNAILTEATLSFLGVGVQPPQCSWGCLLQNAQGWLTTAWWVWAPPGAMIALTVITCNLFGDGLRDALDV